MFTLSTLITYIIVVIGLFVIPGPAVIITASRTIQHGKKAGIMTGLGLATGDFIHTLFAAIGLSAILMTSALAFTIVKYIGAAYLIYLGIRAILEKPTNPELPQHASDSTLKIYSKGILVEILNPKTSLFFLAFLPQFVSPEKGSMLLQFLTLGLIFVILGALYTTLIAVSIQAFKRFFKKDTKFNRWMGKIIGSIYIGLGLKVAFQSR